LEIKLPTGQIYAPSLGSLLSGTCPATLGAKLHFYN